MKKLAFVLLILLLGLPCNASTDNISTIRGQLGDKIDIIWGWNGVTQKWQLNDFNVPQVSDLTYFESGLGYWIKANQDCTLYWGTTFYNLYKGWNLIGWQGTSTPVTPTSTPNPYEQMAYITGGDYQATTKSGAWIGQIIRCNFQTEVKNVSFWLGRAASPGGYGVSLMNLNDDGDPRFVLAVGQIGSSVISSAAMTKITMPLYYDLPIGNYALILRPLGTHNNTNYLASWVDTTNPTYTNGYFIVSEDQGKTWKSYMEYDMLFQIN